MATKEREPDRVEGWAGTKRLRYYHYLRRRYQAGAQDKALLVDEVAQLTRELERLGGGDNPDRVSTVRRMLWIDDARK